MMDSDGKYSWSMWPNGQQQQQRPEPQHPISPRYGQHQRKNRSKRKWICCLSIVLGVVVLIIAAVIIYNLMRTQGPTQSQPQQMTKRFSFHPSSVESNIPGVGLEQTIQNDFKWVPDHWDYLLWLCLSSSMGDG